MIADDPGVGEVGPDAVHVRLVRHVGDQDLLHARHDLQPLGAVGQRALELKQTVVFREVEAGVIPQDQCESLVIVCGVFIHWDAADDKKIYKYNYEAVKLSIARAMKNEPSIAEVLAKKADAKHPFFAG